MNEFIWEDSMWLKSRSNKPVILLFGRSVDDPFVTKHFAIKDVEPYFYAPANLKYYPRALVRVEQENVIKDALGRDIVKCVTQLPSDVPMVRNEFEWTDEADVVFDMRFLNDRGISSAFKEDGARIIPTQVDKPLRPRILYFDIEVKSPPEIMPLPGDAKWPMVSFQCGDSYTDDIKVFTVGVPLVKDYQIACDTEHELYDEVMAYIQEVDPDVLTGWYSNMFDIPYVIKRAENLNIKLNRFTRNPQGWSQPRAESRGYEWSVKIAGRQCFDMLAAFKKWYKAEGEMETYDLKAISKKFGKFEYVDYGAYIDKLFNEKRWVDFVEYGYNDVVALKKIDKAVGLIDFYENLRYVTGVKLEETLKNSKMIESLLVRNGMRPMPTRNYKQQSTSFIGALVLTPTIGIHNNVAVFDATALYPTIIRGFNISPDIDGLVPKVITRILDERDKLRAIRMAGKADQIIKNKEVVLKFLATSFYGVLGWPQFRLFRPELAKKITTTGRAINEYLQKIAKEHGYTSIYGDTDSVFIAGLNSLEEAFELQRIFNEALKVWAKENGSSLDPTVKFEKYYRRILFKKSSGKEGAAKKRYAGHLTWKDGKEENKVSYTGIEIKRSDQAKITKDILTAFLNKALIDDDLEEACKIVRDIYNDTRAGKVALFDVSIPRGLKDREGNNPWARGVKNTEAILGGLFPQGVKPRLIYATDPTEVCIWDDTDISALAQQIRVDWATIADKTIKDKLLSFIESIGYDWESVVNNQVTLQRWF